MNPKLEVQNTKKYGKGVFAREDIKKGQVIHILSGEKISLDELVKRVTNSEERIDDPLQIGKKSDHVVFLFLSIKFDPFITTAYMRHGKFNGMTKRDWKIFTGSLLLGNVYWTLACYMGIMLFEWVWGKSSSRVVNRADFNYYFL